MSDYIVVIEYDDGSLDTVAEIGTYVSASDAMLTTAKRFLSSSWLEALEEELDVVGIVDVAEAVLTNMSDSGEAMFRVYNLSHSADGSVWSKTKEDL